MIVVHSADHGSLIDDDGAGLHEQVQPFDCFWSQFPGMIKMRHDVDFFIMRTVFTNHFQEGGIVGDPERVESGDFGADADDVYMTQLPELLDDGFELAGGHDQRVAPRSKGHC